MLVWRLVLGTLLIVALSGLMWLDAHAARPLIWLGPVAVALGLAASAELLRLLAAQRISPLPAVVYVGNATIIASNLIVVFGLAPAAPSPLVGLEWPLVSLTVCVLALLIAEIRRYAGHGGVTTRLGATLFAFCYIGLLISFLVQLRLLAPGTAGVVPLLALVVVVKLSDIGAYTVGRLVGRHKLAPVLSPGKTIEGAIGGFAFACLGAYLVLGLTWPHGIRQWLPFGLIVGAAGMLGDLAESLLKRDLGQKDSGHWVPGFGGVLDVLDSAMFAAPVAYLCYATGIVSA